MSDKYFIDTNIFIYSFDTKNEIKRETAQNLIALALEKGTGIISYQVVQEFLSAATRKFAVPLRLKDAQKYLDIVLEPLCEVFSSTELYHQALEIAEEWRFSFYDALIVAAALQAECEVLYSEDMQDNQKIRGVTILNPF
jgi:predicted nucleic acid-binding protein